MSFKDKPLKKQHSDNRTTIDVIHSKKKNEFNNNKIKYNKIIWTTNLDCNYKKW